MNEQRILGILTQYGINLIKTKRATLNKLITSDRLLIEIMCEDKYNEDIGTVYYKYEDHIHDVIEALSNRVCNV